jgi:CDP-6-deoxy-D-xylo-4-hexulose-3-dehydrase
MSPLRIGDVVRILSPPLISPDFGDSSGVVVLDSIPPNDDVLVALITQESERCEFSSVSMRVGPGDLDGEFLTGDNIVRLDRVHVLPAMKTRIVARLKTKKIDEMLRRFTKVGVAAYYKTFHSPSPFEAGKSVVPVAGRVYGCADVEHLVDAALDFWLTSGRFNEMFENRVAEFLGLSHVLTTNSGSSANLLAVASLTSPRLGEKRLLPGDEVITVAAGFPTTVNPIIQHKLVPVFVDIDIPTYNVNARLIEAALTERTRAIMLAHTLGNPFDIGEVLRVAERYHLWVIEDCCDAVGSTYRDRLVGTFGHISTLSFYPAHHITTGEGGAVCTNDDQLKRLIESFRDWGRDCWCPTGHDNTCKTRFARQFGDLPRGYDHKYVYSHCGYNLKMTDLQAAVGLAQMDRLESFTALRRHNFHILYERLAHLQDRIILPEATPRSGPSWFGFPITIREKAGTERTAVLEFLAQKKIGTRLLFGGNLTRQPYMSGHTYRVFGELRNTDIAMERTFWIGVYPGLDDDMIDYIAESLSSLFRR